MNVLLCPFGEPGYLYPALAVGIELRGRGHTVTVLARPGAARVVREAGLTPLDATAYAEAGTFSVSMWTRTGRQQYQAVVRAAGETGAGALLTSPLCHGALLAAEALDLPATVLGFAAHMWPYREGGEGEPEHVVARRWRLRELLRHYGATREQTGMPPRRDRQEDRPLIGAGLLLRGDPALEYPGAVLPDGVRHVGPCVWEPRADPAELDRVAGLLARAGKPVVYVHLGRTFGGDSMWPRLNATFTGGPYQAVVELARSADARPHPCADIVTVRVPWMDPLVASARMVLTNGTSSPVLAALRHGRPLAVAPAGSEQPVLSEACVRSGVAVRFPADEAADGTAALTSALTGESPHRVRDLATRLAATRGAAAAAGFVLSTLSPALAGTSGAAP
ncbi:glycosyltransferase [Sphaerisporangium aureirubrum]|uniref:Glycosyltransferase n=1 Tax=Sphaerisporangium aureirubrum TaxID=1544736 RepID=A0ABW1NP29_9ACTN